MEEERKAFDYPKLMCQVIKNDTKIAELEIKRIIFDDTYETNGKLVAYTDFEHPITYCNSFRVWNALIINKEYYQAHKQEVDRIISDIVKRVNSNEFAISDNNLISDELIEGLSKNPNIKKVKLGSKDDVYLLSGGDYETLNNGIITNIETYGVSEELEDNFDSIINFNQNKKMVGKHTYKSLVNEKIIFYISDTLSKEDLENLKYLNENATVDIMFDDCKQVIEIMKRFKELGQCRNFIVNISDKNEFNTYLFEHINDFSDCDNMIISVLGEDFNLVTYLKYERRLIDMITPAMNFSPFEKYMYAYNIVKQFKEYKENKEDKNSSRLLYDLLDSEYMVCAGYASLLCDLLDKLGIPSIYYSVSFVNGLEDVKTDEIVLHDYYDANKEEVLIERSSHARCKVHIVDPKYGINGYYISDPTWDNDMNDDLYNFCLMTYDEYLGISSETFLDIRGYDELYFVHSLEEFYQKLKFLLDNNSDKQVYDYVRMLVNDLKRLDSTFYVELIDKYSSLISKNYKGLSMEMLQDVLLEIEKRIISKNNNYVKGSKIMECVSFLYKNAYGMSSLDAEKKLQKTMEINKERQKMAFHKKYKIDKNDTEFVMLNAINKFDMAKN